VTLNLTETPIVKSRPSVPHGANLFIVIIVTKMKDAEGHKQSRRPILKRWLYAGNCAR